MEISVHLREAMANILSAKLRSILAILGILVGTGAVVALITSSQLATAHALAQFKTLGTQLIAISLSYNDEPGSSAHQQSSGLTLKDIYDISQSTPAVEQIAPYATLYQSIIYQGKIFQGPIVGTTRAFAKVAKVSLASGRMISALDKTKLYGVIGSKLAYGLRQLGMLNPVGQQILVGDRYVTIIGVAESWKPNLFVFINLNDGIILPLDAVFSVAPETKINNLLIKLTPLTDIQQAQTLLTEKLQKVVPTATLNTHNPQQIVDVIQKQQSTFTWLLAAIGGISLLVGGIGVMNIMLVSVIERRREIGIRLAIGAYQSDILIMFLIESVMLTLFGGILGILAGLTVSYLLAYFSHWQFYFFLLPPLLGFVVSVFVGIVSGFYPALRASRLDPIESLHAD